MQLHCPGLAVWQQQHSGLCVSKRLLGRPALGNVQPRQLIRRTQSSKCFSTSADGGEVVRPSAQAAAPVSAPAVPDLTAASSTSGGGSGSNNSSSSTKSGSSARPSGTAGTSGSSAGSYSEFYKAVHSSQYGLQAGPHASGSAGSAHAGNGGSNSRSHVQLHLHQQLQQADEAGAVAAPASGNGSDQLASSTHQPPQQVQQPNTVDTAGVEDAIRKAQEALAAAETSLSSIHKLRSAQPPNKWAALLQVLMSLATAAAAGALLVASHAFGLGWQWAGATIGALALAAQAFKQQNVTEAGAVAAAAACLATFGCSLRFGLVLLAVSYSSCKLRQFKEARTVQDLSSVGSALAAQQQRQQQQEQQAPRDWLEVAGVAAIPTILAIAYGAMAGCLDLPLGTLPNVETWRADLLTLLQGAVLGWYACICGDAWSSELGELSGDQPRLLTTLQPVRKGTHGAVTLLGLSGAAAGGLLVGAVFYCAAVLSPTLWVFDAQRAAAMAQWRVIPLGLMAGLLGSLLDSLLGATLQFTGYDLSTSSITSKPGPSVQRISGLQLHWLTDNVVNVLAASVTAALTALAALATFG